MTLSFLVSTKPSGITFSSTFYSAARFIYSSCLLLIASTSGSLSSTRGLTVYVSVTTSPCNLFNSERSFIVTQLMKSVQIFLKVTSNRWNCLRWSQTAYLAWLPYSAIKYSSLVNNFLNFFWNFTRNLANFTGNFLLIFRIFLVVLIFFSFSQA